MSLQIEKVRKPLFLDTAQNFYHLKTILPYEFIVLPCHGTAGY